MIHVHRTKCLGCNGYLYFQPQLKEDQTLNCSTCSLSYKLIQRNRRLVQLQEIEEGDVVDLLFTLIAFDDEEHYWVRKIVDSSFEKFGIQSLRKGNLKEMPSGVPGMLTPQLKIDKEFLEFDAKNLAFLYQISGNESLNLIALVNLENGSKLIFKIPPLQFYVAAVVGGIFAHVSAVVFSVPAVIASTGVGLVCGFLPLWVCSLLRRRRKETSLVQHLLKQAYTVKAELQILIEKQGEQKLEIERYRLFQRSLSDSGEIDIAERAIALLAKQHFQSQELATKYQKHIERLGVELEAERLTEALPSESITRKRPFSFLSLSAARGRGIHR